MCESKLICVIGRELVAKLNLLVLFARIRQVDQRPPFIANPKPAVLGNLNKLVVRAVQSRPEYVTNLLQPLLNRRLRLIAGRRRFGILLQFHDTALEILALHQNPDPYLTDAAAPANGARPEIDQVLRGKQGFDCRASDSSLIGLDLTRL